MKIRILEIVSNFDIRISNFDMMNQKSIRNKKKEPQINPRVRLEFSAGGIVFRKTRRGIDIAFIEDPWHKWTFAKGHIEKGEKVVQAALRETSEEMGIKGLKPIKQLGRIEIWFKDRYVHKGALIHKYIYYVLMQAPSNAQVHPQKRELMGAVHWVPLSRALESSGYKDVKPLLQKAIKFLIDK